jgi:hypothetical protein
MAELLTDKQRENLNFFYSKLNELLSDPLKKHKFALIYDKEVTGTFDTFENALGAAVSKFQPGEYIIQQIISETEVSGFLYSAFAPA